MILSLEGARCSGKSYAVAHLRDLFPNAVFLPTPRELEEIKQNSPPIGNTFSGIRKNEKWFLSVTEKKFSNVKKDTRYVFERDYTSNLAFSYAYSKWSGINTYDTMVKDVEKGLDVGLLKQPELRIVLDMTSEEFFKRNKVRNKTIEDIWSDPDFLSPLLDHYRTFARIEEPQNSVLLHQDYEQHELTSLVNPFC